MRRPAAFPLASESRQSKSRSPSATKRPEARISSGASSRRAPLTVQEVPLKTQSPLGPTPLDMIRPVLWMAAAAFAAGFGGYLMIGLRAIHPAV